MEIKTQLMDSAQMARSITRITHEIIEKNKGLEDICFVGIKRRGIPLAWRLAETAYRFENVQIPVGYVDISLYRDDMTEVTELPESAGKLCDPEKERGRVGDGRRRRSPFLSRVL